MIVRFFLAVLGGVAMSVTWAPEAAAQISVGEAEAEYEVALDDYNDLLAEREGTFSLYEQALDRVDAARTSGDAAPRDAAHADFQVVAFDLMDLELALEQSGAELGLIRAQYLAALEAREEELLFRLDGAESLSPDAEASLLADWRQVRTRALAVQADAVPEEAIALRPVPELTVDPRDGPVESLEKARFMEERALSYDSLIVDLGLEVDELEGRAQQRQSVEDLLRDVGRFGSDFVQGDLPGLASVPEGSADGGTETPTDGPPDPDAALAQLPLDEQISLLRGARDLAIQYRDQAMVMARVFRDRAEGMRP